MILLIKGKLLGGKELAGPLSNARLCSGNNTVFERFENFTGKHLSETLDKKVPSIESTVNLHREPYGLHNSDICLVMLIND